MAATMKVSSAFEDGALVFRVGRGRDYDRESEPTYKGRRPSTPATPSPLSRCESAFPSLTSWASCTNLKEAEPAEAAATSWGTTRTRSGKVATWADCVSGNLEDALEEEETTTQPADAGSCQEETKPEAVKDEDNPYGWWK